MINPYLHIMRNITVFAVLVIIFFGAQPVFGEQSYGISWRPLLGIVYGQVDEIVYPIDTHAPLLSLLTWEMKPVWYYGISMDFSRTKPMEQGGFFALFALQNGISGQSGILENRDWMSSENSNLTHYSMHNNHTRELFFLDIALGLSLPLQDFLLLKTFISASFMRFSFFGTDGQGIYARRSCECLPYDTCTHSLYHHINDDPTRVSFEGNIISYTQEWLYGAPGISLSFQGGFFAAELSFLASPLIYCVALDEHKEHRYRHFSTQFRDFMLGGLVIEPGLKLSFTAFTWLDFSFDVSWRHISGTKGITYQMSPIGTGTYIQGGEAGAGVSFFKISLGLRVSR